MKKKKGRRRNLQAIFKFAILMFLLTLTSVRAAEDLNVNLKGGVEYGGGEEVMIFAYLTNNSTGVPYGLTGGNNFIIVYNPDMTILNSGVMTELGNGTYYYNFTAPNVVGIYMAYDNASYNANWTVGFMGFHVVPWAGKLALAESELSQIQTIIANIKNSVDKVPVMNDGVNSMTSWFSAFKINFNNAYILGLTIILIIMFAILTTSFYTVDRVKRKEEKSVVGYLD
jgi:hypothetical protein